MRVRTTPNTKIQYVTASFITLRYSYGMDTWVLNTHDLTLLSKMIVDTDVRIL